MEREAVKIVADILQAEMNLEDDQVVLTNQAFPIPPDDRLYIAVGLAGARDFGAKTQYASDPVTGGLVENQSVNRQEMHSIHLMSKGDAARTRNWEVPAALKSTFSQQQQEQYSFKIGYLPIFMNDVSAQEGTARLNEFVLNINVLAAYLKSKPVSYYDKFEQPEIHTNQ